MTGIEAVQEKLSRFNADDHRKQDWFIQAAVASAVSTEESPAFADYTLDPASPVIKKERLVETIDRVAQRLEELSYRKESTANWIGLFINPTNDYEIRPLAIDLYSGLPGIALFLGYRQALTKDTGFQPLLEDCLATVLSYVDRYLDSRFDKFLGAFDGWGGLLHTLTHLGVLLERPALLDKAEEILWFIKDIHTQDTRYDILNGSAGLILVLANFYRIRPKPEILELLIAIGEHVIANATTVENGKGWKGYSKHPLTGFAHGASGIAYALYELFQISGKERFKQVADDALKYERSLFIPAEKNWQDLRDITLEGIEQGKEITNMVAWCTGAPGVGLARAGILFHHPHNQLQEELQIAIDSTLEHGLGKNHSLCHGDLGNLDFLLQAAKVLKDQALMDKISHYVSSLVNTIHNGGFLCGVPLKVENPGLMTGISGIGYQLLRFAFPGKVPSLLSLEGPVQ
jgi:type 2 lantibiotic biosynthesis protein LanM